MDLRGNKDYPEVLLSISEIYQILKLLDMGLNKDE